MGFPSVGELARRCGRSDSHFRATFAAQTGLSCSAYLARRRALAALRRLDADPWVALSAVTPCAGYADPSCLARLVRRLLGVTPRRVRAEMRSGVRLPSRDAPRTTPAPRPRGETGRPRSAGIGAAVAVALALISLPGAAAGQQSTLPEIARILGEVYDGEFGSTVAGDGDLDGDGIPDVVAGAFGEGAVYVFSGADLAAGGTFGLGDALGSLYADSPSDNMGEDVAIAGDVDGDGLADLLVPAYRHSIPLNRAGIVYLVLGRDQGWAQGLSASAFADAALAGEGEYDVAGRDVARAGDVNGDGLDDLLIGAPTQSNHGPGQAHLVLGRAGGWPASLADDDATLVGQMTGDELGIALAGGCDVNGDGFDDWLAGAPEWASDRGAAYLVLGRAGPWPATIDATTEADGMFTGEVIHDNAGTALACIPDLDGDGLDEVVVAAPDNGETADRAGQVYVLFGRAGPWPAPASLAQADASFLGTEEPANAGDGLAGADLDGDGLGDLVIGAPNGTDSFPSGVTYAVLGHAGPWAMDVGLGLLGGHAFPLEEPGGLGDELASSGDLDGDGLGDLLLGDRNVANPSYDEGAVYVLGGIGHVDADGDGFEPWDGDCDDDDPTVYPGAGEAADGLDNDCNGLVDDATELFDDDGDGFAEADGDCDDTDFTINPAAPEYCNGIDDDCDGAPMATEVDDDGDGWLACADCDDADPGVHPGAAEICDDGVDTDCAGDLTWTEVDDDGDGFSECGGDCDDLAAWIHPGADEFCDGLDTDCDESTDEDVDRDGDGYSACAGDCDELDDGIHPGATEICDGVDDDCDGEIDVIDADGDSFNGCDTGDGEVDCDDTDPAIYPGAVEEPYDGVDDDCDGADLTDVDGDGADGGPDGDDCDDGDPAIHPGAAEIPYDGVDDDCDGADLTDVDGDGVDGGPDGDDCNDLDAAVFPDADEICDDGLDNDCDGLVDGAEEACAPAPPDDGCRCALGEREPPAGGAAWAVAAGVFLLRRRASAGGG